MKTIRASVIALAISMGIAVPSSAAETKANIDLAGRSQPHTPVYGRALPPIGYIGFCHAHPRECKSRKTSPVRVVMTDARWQEMIRINDHINAAVEPVTDLELYNELERWTYPRGRGDCEDYVLLKRRYLINMGWPEQALLITVVRDQNNEGHAVLTVATDLGDFILDNQLDEVVTWQDTPYKFEKRQSQSRTTGWVSLNPSARRRNSLLAGRAR